MYCSLYHATWLWNFWASSVMFKIPFLLRIFWFLARWILDYCLKRLVWGFHVLRTLLLSTLVKYCWGVCRFQNTWSNSPKQWGRFSLYFEQVRTDFCQRFVKDLMVLELFSALTVFVLLAYLTIWYCICYVRIHVWPEEWLSGL